MTVLQKIYKALKTIMSDGDANACQVFKSWSVSTLKYGWHFKRFGESGSTYLGKNCNEALETIEEIADYQEEMWG